jgi:hypothetical protein
MIGTRRLVLLCLTFFLAGCMASQVEKELNASIPQIRADPLKYDSKVVRLAAWVRSSHYGLSLESEDFEERIALVKAGTGGVQLPPELTEIKDQVYDQFWEYFENNEIPDAGPHGVRVELDGYIRLLKKNGKLTNEFPLYGQKPIELVPLKIRKMEIYP